MFDCTIITTPEELIACSKQYQQLVENSPHKHYMHHIDYLLYHYEVTPSLESYLIFMFKQNDKLVACAPFFISKHRQNIDFGLFTLFSPSVKSLILYGCKIIHDDNVNINEILKTLFDELHKQSYRFDFMNFYLRTDDSLSTFITKSQHTSRFTSVKYMDEINYYLEIAKDYKTYLSDLLKNKRKPLLSTIKKISKDFEISLEIYHKPEQVDYFMREANKVFASSWKKNLLKHTMLTRDFINYAANKGLLRAYLLTVDNKPIAFLIAIQDNGVCSLLSSAYDSSWKKYSPGQVIILLILEELHGHNKPAFCDFGHGNDVFKKELANKHCYINEFYLYKNMTKGHFIISAIMTCQKIYLWTSALLKKTKLDAVIRKRLRL